LDKQADLVGHLPVKERARRKVSARVQDRIAQEGMDAVLGTATSPNPTESRKVLATTRELTEDDPLVLEEDTCPHHHHALHKDCMEMYLEHYHTCPRCLHSMDMGDRSH